MSNKMVITQPQIIMDSQTSDEWSSGICDCCDDKAECCFACCCCPCFACMKTEEYGQCLCLPLLDICGCVRPVTWTMRVSMRHRYGIKVNRITALYKAKVCGHPPTENICQGTHCNDCLIATCCTSCAWCQMSREMKSRSISIALIGARPTA